MALRDRGCGASRRNISDGAGRVPGEGRRRRRYCLTAGRNGFCFRLFLGRQRGRGLWRRRHRRRCWGDCSWDDCSRRGRGSSIRNGRHWWFLSCRTFRLRWRSGYHCSGSALCGSSGKCSWLSSSNGCLGSAVGRVPGTEAAIAGFNRARNGSATGRSHTGEHGAFLQAAAIGMRRRRSRRRAGRSGVSAVARLTCRKRNRRTGRRRSRQWWVAAGRHRRGRFLTAAKHSQKSAGRRRCRRASVAVVRNRRCGADVEDDMGPVGIERVRLCLIQLDDHSSDRRLRAVQSVADGTHAAEVDRNMLLPGAGSGVGQLKNQTIRMNRRDHRGLDRSTQGDVDHHILAVAHDLYILHSGGSGYGVLRSRQRHQ